MKYPEILPSYPEFRPELAPDQNLCLKSMLVQAEARIRDGYDQEADKWLIDGLNESVVESDEDSGKYVMECQRQGCEANCVIAISGIGAEGTFTVDTPETLEVCIEEM